ILLFTDGLFEVVDKDNNELDIERILDVITDNMHTKVDDLFDLLIKKILTQTKTGAFSDDVCLVGIEIQKE
ncbi:MAG: hypothetical protein EOM20_14600, partial [Spartobacteria bacterium]|nr:hypothetical protein [Spartobacteria bacterium]